MTLSNTMAVRVVDITTEAANIKRFRLARVDGGALGMFSPGAHCVVIMRDGPTLRRNPYSLMSSPFETSHYDISVLKTSTSRGGSRFMHDGVAVGDTLDVSPPLNLFPLERRAKKHLFLAGGIGITPFISMMQQVSLDGGDFELHYAMRSKADGAYWAELSQIYGGRVNTYFDDAKQQIPLAALLEHQPLGTHLYVCGPSGMIDWVLSSARDCGWPDENVHSERFAVPPRGAAFEIELARSKKVIAVTGMQSMLEAIESAGVDVQYLCRGGACGQCETQVLSCDGVLHHNDHFLSDADRASGKKIMLCVSRIDGRRVVLNL